MRSRPASNEAAPPAADSPFAASSSPSTRAVGPDASPGSRYVEPMAGTPLRTRGWSTRVRLAGALLLAVTMLGGVVATILVRRDAIDDRKTRERTTADVAASTLSQVVIQTLSELRGANGLV